jgi:HlyD family secretion protein
MDMPLPPPTPAERLRRAWPWALAVALLLGAGGWAWRGGALADGWAATLTVPRERLTISTVARGTFEDFIPLRGPAQPESSVLLDAVEGGRVEKKLVEDGAQVQAGQPLLVLANSALRLEVIRSESEVAQQLNNLRTLELQIERQRSDDLRQQQEVQWALERGQAKAARDARLVEQGFITAAAAQDSTLEARHHERRLATLETAMRSEAAMQRSQAEQLRLLTRQLQANLELARGNLEALTVRAPIAGQLSAFDVSPGQSLARGQRIGQVDDERRFKLVAAIDEFHLPRVAVGQAAVAEIAGQSHALRLRKLNPQVRQGQFEAELVFDGASPAGLRRGQTLQARLALEAARPALLLPAGPFLSDGGAAEVFVLNGERGDRAERRAVRLGRRNIQHVEVLAGLVAGEQVVTSSYADFHNTRTLRLSP